MKLKVKNFNVKINNKDILNNININFKKNSIHALIGPSGCGKSTFLKSINRMNDLIDKFTFDGNIFLDDKNIYDIDEVSLRKKVGMVFQKATPFPKSIFENVAYGLRIHGIKDKKFINKKVKESLKASALWDEVKDKLNSSALNLSGGQQQRLCIARTIAVNPDVILMDEPCSALDPISTFKIEDLIQKLKRKYTIVLVTHNMQQAKRVSDFTSFFLNGHVIESGKTNQIFLNPKKEKTESYISGRFG